MKYSRAKYHKKNETSRATREILSIMWRFRKLLWVPLIFTFLLEIFQMGNRLFISEILKRVEVQDSQAVAFFLALKPVYDYFLRKVDVIVVLTVVRNIGYDLYRAYEKMTVEHTVGLGHAFFSGVPIS